VEIPPEIQIKSTIRVGSVYYFKEEALSSSQPHYFIVLNIKPRKDTVILLVCASSQIEKVIKRRRTCPSNTLIKISPAQYPDFKFPSIIDCNIVFERTIDQLIEKLTNKKLRLKTEMKPDLVKKLRQGVFASPLIENRIKSLLNE
jgi:hypothetical protein